MFILWHWPILCVFTRNCLPDSALRWKRGKCCSREESSLWAALSEAPGHLGGTAATAVSTVVRASLVVQWLKIYLLMHGTWVWSLVWEGPTCQGATKPCATITEPVSCTDCSPLLRDRAARREKPLQWDARAPQREPGPRSQPLEKSPRGALKTQDIQK